MRVRQRETLLKIRDFVERAIEAAAYPGTTPKQFFEFLLSRVADADMGCFIGLADGVPLCIAVAMLPTTAFMMYPQVILLSNTGSRAVSRKVGAGLRVWLLGNGHAMALGCHMEENMDEFMRSTRHFGTPRRWASIVAYELT